jgi:amino acid permease
MKVSENTSIKTTLEIDAKENKLEPSTNKSNFIKIFLSLVTSTLGISTLYMPKLLLQTGLILGISVLAFSALLNYVTCNFLCKAAKNMGATSYTMLSRKILGNHAYIVDIFFVLNILGIIVGNQTFVVRTLCGCINKLVFGGMKHNTYGYMWTGVGTVLAVNFLLLPFIRSKNLNQIKFLGKLTIIGFSYALGTIIAVYLIPDFFGFSIEPVEMENMKMIDFSGLQSTFGMYLLSMAIHSVIIEIESELKPNTSARSSHLIFVNKISCFMFYSCFSIYGFLSIFQAEKVEKLHNFFLFFLYHQNLENMVLRSAHIAITFSILFSSVFCYIPLIRYFQKIANNDALDYIENEQSVYQVI